MAKMYNNYPRLFCRKKRQLRYSLKCLAKRIEEKQNWKSKPIQKLLKKCRRLITELLQDHRVKKTVSLAKLSLVLASFQWSTSLNSQEFAPVVEKPFGLNTEEEIAIIGFSFGDLDEDGDFDMLFTQQNPYTGVAEFFFLENDGSATTPQYDLDNAIESPFGIVNAPNSFIVWSELVDLDNDGDLDLLALENIAGSANGLTYFENISDDGLIEFAAGNLNPFNLNLVQSVPKFVDIDSDGDLDIISFQNAGVYNLLEIGFNENIGDAENPSFSEIQSMDLLIPSGIALAGTYNNLLAVGDIDVDGDFDILIQTSYALSLGSEVYGASFYFENNGNGFEAPVQELLLEESEDDFFNFVDSKLVDIDGDMDLDYLRSRVFDGVETDFDLSIGFFENLTVVMSGIEDRSSSFSIFPNPSSDYIRANVSESIEEFSIISASGKLISTFASPDGYVINIKSLAPGLYFLLAQSNGKSVLAGKFVKE